MPVRLLLWAGVWILLILFVLWPVGEVLVQSFLRHGSWDFSIWGTLFTRQSGVLLHSIIAATLVTFFTILIAFFIALYLVYGKKYRRLLNWVIMLSMISPPFVPSMAFIMLFGRRGYITWHLLGLEWNPYGLQGIVFMQTFTLTGLASLLMAISLHGLDHNLERASLDLGAAPFRTFLKITLPLARPGILAAALIVFVRSLSDFATPLFVGGSYHVLAARAYSALIDMGNFQLSAAMNVMLLVPALFCFWAARRMQTREVFSLGPGSNDDRLVPLPWHVNFAACSFTLLFLLAQLALYGLILLGAFTTTWGRNFTPTLAHLHALLDFNGTSIVRSLLIATFAGIGTAFLGMLGAWLLRGGGVKMRGVYARLAEFAMEVPYMLPGTFFGLGYLLAFTRLPFEVSATILIAFNCLFRQLSPALRAGLAGVSGINPETENAARDLGAGPWQTFRDVTLPMLKPSAVFAFISAFAADIVSTGPIIFLVTPYAKVMSVDMFAAITAGDFGAANAMALAIILIVLAINSLALLFQQRSRHGA